MNSGAYLHPLGHGGTGLHDKTHLVRCDDCLVILNSGHRYYSDHPNFSGHGHS